MLAGEPPFTGPTAQAIIARAVQRAGAAACAGCAAGVPGRVEQAVMRALAPVPADRFATAAEFARALQLGSGHSRRRTTGSHRQLPIGLARRPSGGRTHPGVGVLLGLGVLFAWRRSTPVDDEATAAKRVAVLPFENLGDSADAYFADGVANEVRAKLSEIEGLVVIARGSSNEYGRTTKTGAGDRP